KLSSRPSPLLASLFNLGLNFAYSVQCNAPHLSATVSVNIVSFEDPNVCPSALHAHRGNFIRDPRPEAVLGEAGTRQKPRSARAQRGIRSKI
ncbi:hypothetical protein B0H14DRAFT_3893286, partial [Mycena olivaceomarginata]